LFPALIGGGFGAHALRATAATNMLDHQADIAEVQESLGHAGVEGGTSVTDCGVIVVKTSL
jgi:site-specific recombinase XerD